MSYQSAQQSQISSQGASKVPLGLLSVGVSCMLICIVLVGLMHFDQQQMITSCGVHAFGRLFMMAVLGVGVLGVSVGLCLGLGQGLRGLRGKWLGIGVGLLCAGTILGKMITLLLAVTACDVDRGQYVFFLMAAIPLNSLSTLLLLCSFLHTNYLLYTYPEPESSPLSKQQLKDKLSQEKSHMRLLSQDTPNVNQAVEDEGIKVSSSQSVAVPPVIKKQLSIVSQEVEVSVKPEENRMMREERIPTLSIGVETERYEMKKVPNLDLVSQYSYQFQPSQESDDFMKNTRGRKLFPRDMRLEDDFSSVKKPDFQQPSELQSLSSIHLSVEEEPIQLSISTKRSRLQPLYKSPRKISPNT